ncbi:MAG: hypothetical protein R3C53_23100 [Pirellulaceae bacterium]
MTTLNRTKFLIALLAAACAGSLVTACDQCDAVPSKVCKSCQKCDDRGLLDVVDLLAGRVQSSIKAVTPSIPKVRLCICKTQTCTCQASRHSNTAHKASQCDDQCECSSGGESSPRHYAPTPAPFPAPSTPSILPFSAPEIHEYRPSDQPPYSQPAPAPRPVPASPELVPLPDTAVDPFRDDSANRVRRVPARTIQHSKPATRYGERYDPQAFNAYRVRLSDDMPAIRATVVPRVGFEAQSSRRPAAHIASYTAESEQPSPAVVTANSIAPIESNRSTAADYANPLR